MDLFPFVGSLLALLVLTAGSLAILVRLDRRAGRRVRSARRAERRARSAKNELGLNMEPLIEELTRYEA
jgi:hypothetical protein